jgi:hypothetical protein
MNVQRLVEWELGREAELLEPYPHDLVSNFGRRGGKSTRSLLSYGTAAMISEYWIGSGGSQIWGGTVSAEYKEKLWWELVASEPRFEAWSSRRLLSTLARRSLWRQGGFDVACQEPISGAAEDRRWPQFAVGTRERIDCDALSNLLRLWAVFPVKHGGRCVSCRM